MGGKTNQIEKMAQAPPDDFKKAAEEWLNEKKEQTRESTYSVYHHIVTRHILPKMGDILLDDFSERLCNDFLKLKMQQGSLLTGDELSWKTVSDIRGVLKSILERAGKEGRPELLTIRLKMPPQRPFVIEVLTTHDQKRLEKALIKSMSPNHLGILLSLYDGLRIGEVCGLRWGDIDLKKGTLRIERTVMRIQDTDPLSGRKTKVIITPPKTYNSIRTIPVPKDVLQILKDNQGDKGAYVLTGTDKYMEPRALLSKYKSILKKANLPSYKFHSLRHTFASRCIEQGFDVKSLSEILGHSNVKITMDRYVHPSLEHKQKQMNRLRFANEKKGKKESDT